MGMGRALHTAFLAPVAVLASPAAEAQGRDPPFLVVIHRDQVATLSSAGASEYGIRPAEGALVGPTTVACDSPEAVGAIDVRLADGRMDWCSGTLITPSHVLTAAHCVAREGTTPLSFRVGEDPESPRGQHRVVRHVVFGGRRGLSGYSPATGLGDVAVLTLESPVTDVAPIPVPREEPETFRASEYQMVGYGQRSVDATGLGRRRCVRTVLGTTGGGHLQGRNRHDVCHGDSGGPLFAWDASGTRKMVALVSMGDPACEIFQLHTQLSPYLRWIREEIGDASRDSDEDDLPDSDDRCPTEPETHNAFEDADGCPDTLPPPPFRWSLTGGFERADVVLQGQREFHMNLWRAGASFSWRLFHLGEGFVLVGGFRAAYLHGEPDSDALYPATFRGADLGGVFGLRLMAGANVGLALDLRVSIAPGVLNALSEATTRVGFFGLVAGSVVLRFQDTEPRFMLLPSVGWLVGTGLGGELSGPWLGLSVGADL